MNLKKNLYQQLIPVAGQMFICHFLMYIILYAAIFLQSLYNGIYPPMALTMLSPFQQIFDHGDLLDQVLPCN